MPQRAKILILEDQISFHDAIDRLMVALRESRFGLSGIDPFFLRMKIKTPKQSALTILRSSKAAEKFFWSDRERSFEWAGIGVAIKITGSKSDFNAATQQMQGIFDTFGNDIQFFGGSRFDGVVSKNDLSWAHFPELFFALPTLELETIDAETTIALNLRAVSQADVEKTLDLLSGLREDETLSTTEIAPPSDNARNLSAPDWNDTVGRCAQLFEHGQLEKIVLAHVHDFWFDESIDPTALLFQLDQRSVSTYRFLLQLSHHHAFVGASPERLFARNGMRIESEAQAGTRPRGKNEEADEALALELLESEKEFVEHDLVFRDIENSLSPLCRDSGWIDQRNIIKLSHVQHLRSRFGGILLDAVSDSRILDALHPTPAVCGRPKEAAQKYIRQFENFDRGYYCGPIGMIGKDNTELAVALRSALINDRRLRVFAGAGLVKGSKAEDEWNEIDSKMRLYYDIVGHSSRR